MRIIFFILLFASVHGYTQDSITVGFGPEDMILDTLMGQERLLISCNDWRKAGTETGIWEYDFKTKKAKRLTLVFPTAEYKLRPHGIHLVNGHLFIVNHPQKKDSINRNKKRRDRIKQEILRFRVMGDSLVMEVAIRHKLLKRPNDVFATSSSEVYWSNFKLFSELCSVANPCSNIMANIIIALVSFASTAKSKCSNACS